MTHHHLSVRASRPRRRRVLAAVLATAALTLGLAGCVQREDTAESIANETVDVASLQDLTLRVGDQKGGTEALLRASGELEKLPFTIEFSTFTSGPPQIEAATAGKIDFAVTGNTPPIFGAAANAKVKIVTGYANNASGDAILIPGRSTLASVADLNGKKVAVAKGSSAHGHLLLQLNKVNLTLGPGKAYQALFPPDARKRDLSSSELLAIHTRLPDPNGWVALDSHSHRNKGDVSLPVNPPIAKTLHLGSSLKFCLVARGEADIYVRNGPTSEWDTAAGQAILTAAGGDVTTLDGNELEYGKREKNFLNPSFVAWGRKPLISRS